MVANLPGPYQVEYEYVTSGLTHKLAVNCIAIGSPAPGSIFADIQLQQRGGATDDALTLSGNLWAFIRPLLPTATTVSACTLWRFTPGTFERTFIAAREANLPAGSNATAFSAAAELVLSFRSANGGIMYIRVEEQGTNTATPGYQALIANAAGAATQQLAAYVLSSAGWIIARDDSFPVAPYRQLIGTNETIFKKRYRP